MWRHRSRYACAAAILLLAACAPAPERPPEEGSRFVFRTANSPYAAAICIARNARRTAGWTAEERTVGTSSTEVIVRSAEGEALAVARVDDNGTFSRTAVLVTPAAPSAREALARGLVADC